MKYSATIKFNKRGINKIKMPAINANSGPIVR